jgi:autotransporter-associated beta strand protein
MRNSCHRQSSIHFGSFAFFLIFVAWAHLTPVHAQTATSAGDLENDLNFRATPATASTTITFGNSISLSDYSSPNYNANSGFLGTINAPTGGAVLTINGANNTLTGGSANALFFASPENETANGGVTNPAVQNVTIENLTITGGASQGGSGDGGGAGLGGAIFDGAGVHLTLNNVTLIDNQAQGGMGGNAGDGGGGIGGDSGDGGGGGGIYAAGSAGGTGGGVNGGGPDTDGGFGGGGGRNDGHGGFGGGAGSGVGGFGGGGGGNAGGFGGGGGVADVGGVGGGGHSGGGAGFGGAIFVQNGAAVTVMGSSTIADNTVTAGTGANNGAAVGSDIFIMSGGSVTLAPGTTTTGMVTTPNTVTIGAAADDAAGVVSDVADDSVYSLPTGQSYTPGNGAGAALVIGNAVTPGGTVFLHGNNTYAGGTQITNGTTLEVFQDDNLGAVDSTNGAIGALTLSGGGELLTAPSTTDGGGTAFTTGRTVSITDAGTLAGLTGTTATYNGVISGSTGALTVGDATGNDDGTVILAGTNTYGGGTTVASGTLEAENNSALGSAAVTVDSGASLGIEQGITIANDITISGTGYNSQGAIVDDDSNNGSAYFTGTTTLAGNASALDPGAGVLMIQGPIDLSTYTLSTGGTNVEFSGVISGGGGLTITNGFAVIDASSSNLYSGVTTVDSGAQLNIDATNNAVAIPGDLNVSGTVDDFASADISSSSVLTLSSNSAQFVFSGAGLSQTLAGLSSTNGVATITSESFPSGTADTLTLDESVTYSYAGMIENGDPFNQSIALVKIGGGTQILTGADTYSGGTTVEAGTLAVGTASGTTSTALGAGDVNLTGGTLTTTGGGTGLTIDVGGNYTQGADGTLTLNIYGANNYDSLNLTGANKTGNLGGTLNLVFDTTSFTPNKSETFTVVTTVGGIDPDVSAMYLNPETNLAALKLTATGMLTDTDHDFVVTVNAIQQDFTGLFGGNYLNPNQRAVASNLDGYINNVPVNGNYSPLIVALDQISTDPQSLAGAFDELMPLNFANFTSSTAFNNTSFFTQQMDNYFASHRGQDGSFIASAGGIDYSGLSYDDEGVANGLQQIHSRLLAWNPAPSTGLLSDSSQSMIGGVDMKDTKSISSATMTNRWNFFISGDVVLGQDFSDAASSEAHQDTTTGAMQLGVDYAITPHFMVGALFGYGHTDADLDEISSNASVDTYSPGVYASYSNQGWYANALGSYGFSNYSQQRNVNIGPLNGSAYSNPDGDQIVGNLDGGYDFHHGAWTFGPTDGLQYVHLDVDSYNETGLAAGNLSVNDNQADSLRSRLGGHVSYVFQNHGVVFTPHFDASWQHEFLDQSRGITSQFDGLGAGSFVVTTQNPSRDSALLDTGLDAELNKTVTVFGDYTVQAGQQNYFGESVQAGVKIGF